MKVFHITPAPRTAKAVFFTDPVQGALLDRLRDVKRADFDRALIIGGDPGKFQAVKTIGRIEQRDWPVEGEHDFFPFDAGSLDLIVAVGTLHRVNDLPGALIQMRRALKPDGLFLSALVGGETLFELRDSITRADMALHQGSCPRIHPMIDLQTAAALMQRAGFALPVVDSDAKTVFYRQLKTLLKDIKNAGEGLALLDRSRKYAGRNFWNAVEDDYKTRHASQDGLLMATIEIIYAIGWGPSDAQQKPLKPGSAQNRLADALGAAETPLPDRTRPN